MGVVLSACGASSSGRSSGARDATSGSHPALIGAPGGTVTVALDQVPTNLNDHTIAGDTFSTRLLDSAILPQVFQVGPGQTPVLDTAVVQSAELVSLSPQTIVYQIAPRATWSDGVPISASDFEYAWESQRGGAVDVDGTPDSVESTLGYRDIDSVTGSNGGKTVTVVFKNAFGDWESLFDDLLPTHIAEDVGWNNGFSNYDPAVLVSGGPWEVDSWQPGTQIVLGRNPHWWGTPPRLDKIVVQAEPDPVSLLRALWGGSVQVAYPSDYDTALLAALSSSQDLETTSSLGTTMLQLVFNTKHAPFDDASVREGIAHEIDRAGIVTDLIQPINRSVWVDDNHLFANSEPQYVDNASAYVQADPVTAQRLLTQGGLVAGADGTWSYHGAALTVQLAWAQDDPWSELVEPDIAAELTAAGFSVNLEPVSSTQFSGSVLPSGSFDLALVPIQASAYPSEMASYFSTATNLTSPGVSKDWSGFSDPALDSLLTQAFEQLGSNLADPLYNQADQMLWSEMPTLPLFAEPTLLVNSAWVNDVQDDPGGLGPMFTVTSWYELEAAPARESATKEAGARRHD